jgi:hypothetical protein
VDFHEEYRLVKLGRKEAIKKVSNEDNRSYYMQLATSAIHIGSGVGFQYGKAKRYTPTVPLWLYNAVMEVSSFVNMSSSDLVFLCWCIGVQNCLPEDMVPGILGKDTSTIIRKFSLDIEYMSKEIEIVLDAMK